MSDNEILVKLIQERYASGGADLVLETILNLIDVVPKETLFQSPLHALALAADVSDDDYTKRIERNSKLTEEKANYAEQFISISYDIGLDANELTYLASGPQLGDVLNSIPDDHISHIYFPRLIETLWDVRDAVAALALCVYDSKMSFHDFLKNLCVVQIHSVKIGYSLAYISGLSEANLHPTNSNAVYNSRWWANYITIESRGGKEPDNIQEWCRLFCYAVYSKLCPHPAVNNMFKVAIKQKETDGYYHVLNKKIQEGLDNGERIEDVTERILLGLIKKYVNDPIFNDEKFTLSLMILEYLVVNQGVTLYAEPYLSLYTLSERIYSMNVDSILRDCISIKVLES